MFIQTQDRDNIINTFYVRKIIRTEDNQIHAILEFATKTKPAVIEVLGVYDSREKMKAVFKALMFDMRKREQAFKMPKNEKVNLNPPKLKGMGAGNAVLRGQGQPQKQAQAPTEAPAETPAPAPAPAPAPEAKE